MPVLRVVRLAFQKQPYVCNCLIYGSLYLAAEFSQQTLNRKVFIKEGSPQPYDTESLKRFAIVGTTVYPTMLYTWYRWLDKQYVGKAATIIIKKLALDQFLFTPPLIAVFYISMSVLEHKNDIFEECQSKLIPTFKSNCLFWIPAQTVNFLLIPPSFRLIFMGSCSLVWVNILCWFKHQKY